MDVVLQECSTIVSLSVHIEGLQSFVEAPDKRTLAFHKFLLADFQFVSAPSPVVTYRYTVITTL